MERQVTELRKGSTSQPDGLPVGGERVVKHLLDAEPGLTREEAIAEAMRAFTAIGQDSPDLAIEWLRQSQEDQLEDDHILPADRDALSMLTAKLIGYGTFDEVPTDQQRVIKRLTSGFVRRQDESRTVGQLQDAIAKASAAGRLALA